jgi:hypothetical protein
MSEPKMSLLRIAPPLKSKTYRRQTAPVGRDKPCPYNLIDDAALRDDYRCRLAPVICLAMMRHFATTM